MAGSFTDYLEAALINAAFRATTFTSPASVYVALFTTAPSDTAAGTEVTTSGTAYARQAVTFGAPSQVSGAAQISNSSDVTFPTATANYGTVVGFGIMDASSGGNMLAWGDINGGTGLAVNSGNQAKFAAGQLTIALS